MDKEVLMQAARELYVALQLLSGYPVPERLPAVHLIPRPVIQDLACEKPCQIRAFYHPDFGILLDETLNLSSSAYDRSIFLHELVHHAQQVSGKFETLSSECTRRAAAETEAYEIQNRYLAHQEASERIPIVRWHLICRE
jgi:hypothetical protein